MIGNPRRKATPEHLAAFDAIVARYESPLLRYATRILTDEDAAQDIVQDSFIKLFRRWKDPLEPSPQVSSWLYRVAHNAAVDYILKQHRRNQLHERHGEEQPRHAPPQRGSFFRISEAAERAADALHTLTLREQQLVILKIYEEKSYKEIGAITGLTTSNVGYILHHAMKKLAAELKQRDQHEQ